VRKIQILLDTKLLRAVDQAARRAGKNRSAFVRDALRYHLSRLQTLDLEHRDREGYRCHPDTGGELQGWENVTAWPTEDS
jgi:metal-responsive CopG/Arc/MetJ family transcriptional regulator